MAGKMNMKKPDSQAINIQSFIRVRPLGPKEKKAHVLEFGKKEVVIKSGSEASKINKTLMYDRVFNEDSKQIVVYNAVVKPMIKEVLQGYNCTVFAYGQTGTGKTYTMTGNEFSQGCWEENIHAGIVPRAMHDLFNELMIQSCEYQVSVSYMELYNERLRSLLKDADDTDLKLIDDLEGGVLVKGLLPTPVKSKEEAFNLLQQGAEKRAVAATQMNVNSSRSHTIFTINVNIKESAVAGKDDVLRCGKLHLVDLAGSENVSKSGASENIHKTASGVNKRLAEASNINKSLLTLGRVITCLTENNPHIPYRESKLTRFLQDSLGGKTKTCIIGTISPAQSNLDETESTLNYANKARSIKNKPVKNQTISKKDFMQVASEEITKLRKDLEAVRQGEGFYISKESHEEMITRMKELDDQVKDWHEKYSRIKESYEQTKDMFSSLSSDFDDKCAEYEELNNLYKIESRVCQEKMTKFAKEIVVREYFIEEYKKTEGSLTEEAKKCKSVLENLLDTTNQLHDKIDRKQSNESDNAQILENYKENSSKRISEFQGKLDSFLDEEKQVLKEISNHACTLSRVFEEESEKILSTSSDFEAQMKELNHSLLQVVQNKKHELTDELATSTTLGEEIMTQLAKLHKNIIQTNVLPPLKNIRDQLSLVTRTSEKANSSFSKCEAQLKTLIPRITKSNESLLKDVTEILRDIEASRQEHVKISSKPAEIRSDVSQIAQQIKQFEKQLKIMKNSCDSIMSKNDEVCNSLVSSAVKTEAFEAKAKSCTTQLDSAKSDIAALNEVCNKQSQNHEVFTNEVARSINSVLNEFDSQVQIIEDAVEKNLEQVQEICGKQQEYLGKMGPSLDEFTDHIMTQTSTMYGEKVNQFVGEIAEKINEERSSVDHILREQNRVVRNKLQSMNDNPELSQIIETLDEDLNSVSYKKYVPLGTTPQRLNKDQLNYPRKFVSTAPRTELVRKMREKYPETESVPNDNLNLKELLPAGPFFNGDIQICDSSIVSVGSVEDATTSKLSSSTSSTPRVHSSLKRRSLSMPDLNVTDTVFAVPSSVDNKENRSRRPIKSKIPDAGSAKKKRILLTPN